MDVSGAQIQIAMMSVSRFRATVMSVMMVRIILEKKSGDQVYA